MDCDFYPAGEDCLLILTGLGGSVRGYNDKYAKIARTVGERFNCSAVVCAIPQSCWEHPGQTFENALNCAYSRTDFKKLLIFGNSAGGTLALWYAYLYPQIAKVLAVNPVLNLNYHLLKEGLQNFCGEKMIICSGEKDGGAQWINFLQDKPNLLKKIISGADHNFSGMESEFCVLPGLLFGD